MSLNNALRQLQKAYIYPPGLLLSASLYSYHIGLTSLTANKQFNSIEQNFIFHCRFYVSGRQIYKEKISTHLFSLGTHENFRLSNYREIIFSLKFLDRFNSCVQTSDFKLTLSRLSPLLLSSPHFGHFPTSSRTTTLHLPHFHLLHEYVLGMFILQ